MNSNVRNLFILFSLLAATAAVSARHNLGGGGGGSHVVGGWSPIKYVNDPEVQDVAKFAVQEYNKQGKGSLVYVKVVSGKSQVVSGMNYQLVISAKDGSGATRDYDAQVYDQPWTHTRNLTSFGPHSKK